MDRSERVPRRSRARGSVIGVYRWPKSTMFVYEDGRIQHQFFDGTFSETRVYEGDEQFAKDLGITPAQHKHIHELLHMMVGFRFFGTDFGSPIVWRSAHKIPQPDDANDEEEIVWQLTREVFARHYTDKWYNDGPRRQLEKVGVNVDQLVYDARVRFRMLTEGKVSLIVFKEPW